jgi:hypothetical protein
MVHFWAARGNFSLLDAGLWASDWWAATFWGAEEGIKDTIEDRDADLWTPLHWACRSKSPETVRLLLEFGADKNARTRREWLPLDVAIYHGRALFEKDSKLEALLQPDKDGGSGPTRGSPDDLNIPSADTDLADEEPLGEDGNTSRTPSPSIMSEDLTFVDESPVDSEEEEIHPATPKEVYKGPTGDGDFYCDSCRCTIFGPRYHCDQCFDFDMCFKCFRHVRSVHYENHIFVKYDPTRKNLKEFRPWVKEEEKVTGEVGAQSTGEPMVSTSADVVEVDESAFEPTVPSRVSTGLSIGGVERF